MKNMKMNKVGKDHFVITEVIDEISTILYSTPHPVTLRHGVKSLELDEVKNLFREGDSFEEEWEVEFDENGKLKLK